MNPANIRLGEDVLKDVFIFLSSKMFSAHNSMTSSCRRLIDALQIRLEDIWKTSSRRFGGNVLKDISIENQTYNMNDNLKNNILMSENIRQKKTNNSGIFWWIHLSSLSTISRLSFILCFAIVKKKWFLKIVHTTTFLMT